jgi:ribosome-associated toxin RatA of RatAB toxin-antitoxin module
MEGIKFSEKIIINCSPEEAFDYTQDYKNRLEWDTFLKRAELMDGATKAGKGVKAYCVAKNGPGMVTEYVSFNRPKATAIKMTRGPYMFKNFHGSWTFKDISNSQTEVIFLYSFRLRFPFNLMTRFIKSNLKSNVRRRLTDLKTNIENEARSANMVFMK